MDPISVSRTPGLHPLHGPHHPSTGTPRRRPRSVRRTTHLDLIRPGGMNGPLELHGHARDLVTDGAGQGRVAHTAQLSAEVDYGLGRTVRRLDTVPIVPDLDALVGVPAAGGFRRRIDEAAGHLRAGREPLYTLLDDIPVGTLISGHALSATGADAAQRGSGYLPVADQCAGFVSGGLLMSSFDGAVNSVVVTGPPAPGLDDPADPDSWHPMEVLPVHALRRRRRLDVAADVDDPTAARIDAMFRDTYIRADGVETIIHEYSVDATVHLDGHRITSSEATVHVLPWRECPAAAASAGRVTGMTLAELNGRVRAELHGTATCTHLNDLLRNLADVSALIGLLPES
ncbi:DUF2889 domain-containing protein [Rhodococcus koreensis]